MKKYIYILVIIFCTSFLISNSAQPGVWNAGGSGSFTLLYPEDTIAYKKIQMKSESIYMQLHKGFATVKGNYFFKNTSKDTLRIKVGYPINNVFENISYNQYANQVVVDGLYKVKGLVNEKEIELFKKPNKENDNWYVWEITFPPNKITEFIVYFLVNTNNAKILEGYNSAKKNAFIYLIETGSIWKSPIEKGNFYLQLKDNLSIEDVKVSTPTLLFFDKENSILKFSLSDYGKVPDQNFVITYSKTLDNFNFEEVTSKSNFYFKEINQFSDSKFNQSDFKEIELSNAYKVNSNSNNAVGIIFYLAIYGLPILIGVILLIFLIFIYKRFKKR
jgi:hypothetical protein